MWKFVMRGTLYWNLVKFFMQVSNIDWYHRPTITTIHKHTNIIFHYAGEFPILTFNQNRNNVTLERHYGDKLSIKSTYSTHSVSHNFLHLKTSYRGTWKVNFKLYLLCYLLIFAIKLFVCVCCIDFSLLVFSFKSIFLLIYTNV